MKTKTELETQPETEQEAERATEGLAKKAEITPGNGNKAALPETKAGGAQRGGPGIERAMNRQPPDADLPDGDPTADDDINASV